MENFLPFSSNLKLPSANSLRLEESKICRLGKGYTNFHVYVGICYLPMSHALANNGLNAPLCELIDRCFMPLSTVF